MAKKESTEEKLERWRKSDGILRKQTVIVRIFGFLTLIGWVLFLYKVSQTPNYALQHDPNVQAQIGYWVVGLGLITFFAIMGWAGRRIGRSVMGKLKNELISDFRVQLGQTEDANQRSLLESQLRELGA